MEDPPENRVAGEIRRQDSLYPRGWQETVGGRAPLRIQPDLLQRLAQQVDECGPLGTGKSVDDHQGWRRCTVYTAFHRRDDRCIPCYQGQSRQLMNGVRTIRRRAHTVLLPYCDGWLPSIDKPASWYS